MRRPVAKALIAQRSPPSSARKWLILVVPLSPHVQIKRRWPHTGLPLRARLRVWRWWFQKPWVLDAKAAADLVKWGVKVVSSTAGRSSLEALQTLSRTTANDVALARVSNNFYAEGASSIPAGLHTSAGVIPSNFNKTTTVLGRYSPDMDSVINVQMKVIKTEDFGVKPGGFNVLNVDDAKAASSANFFEQYNKPFLEQAIKREDDIAPGYHSEIQGSSCGSKNGCIKR